MPKTTAPTLVCFALPEEARPFQRLCRGREDLRVVVTGMGRRNTERSVSAALAEVAPARVLTCGFAGGLDPLLPLNTVVGACDDIATAARLGSHGARLVRFHCAERMAVTVAEKSALRRETAADAVEMESRWIHELCRVRRILCATVRVISDTASETMPLDFNKLTTAGMKMDFVKLAFALLAAPNKIPALLRLQRQTQCAAGVLAEFLQRFTAD